jgi:hypothetical protein
MSKLIEKARALNLPKGEYVIIGSGLLDAWGLRTSHDLDLVVSPRQFETLRASGAYRIEEKHGDEVLLADDIEIWRDWKADATFAVLNESAIEVEGEKFAHPDIIIKRKTERGSEKDLEDIRLLKEYLAK